VKNKDVIQEKRFENILMTTFLLSKCLQSSNSLGHFAATSGEMYMRGALLNNEACRTYTPTSGCGGRGDKGPRPLYLTDSSQSVI